MRNFVGIDVQVLIPQALLLLIVICAIVDWLIPLRPVEAVAISDSHLDLNVFYFINGPTNYDPRRDFSK